MMPTPEEIAEAEKYLRAIPELDWLTKGGQQWYKTNEVAEGLGIGDGVIRAACERGEIAGALNYGKAIGWRMPRTGLMVFVTGLKGRSL